MKTRKQSAYMFFKTHAGFCYDPKTETPEQGKQRCARALAEAEQWAKSHGVIFDWSQDELTNRDWTDEGPEYHAWQVLARHGDDCASLGGVDFGHKGDEGNEYADAVEPWGQPYARVVEAELALELMKQHEAAAV